MTDRSNQPRVSDGVLRFNTFSLPALLVLGVALLIVGIPVHDGWLTGLGAVALIGGLIGLWGLIGVYRRRQADAGNRPQ